MRRERFTSLNIYHTRTRVHARCVALLLTTYMMTSRTCMYIRLYVPEVPMVRRKSIVATRQLYKYEHAKYQ